MKSKFQSHVDKGDKHASKNKFDKALKEYKKAKDLDPENKEIYSKLVDTHKKATIEWNETDFTESLEWTMKLQELENPKMKRLHAQMTPEWKRINGLIRLLLETKEEAEETDFVEKISAYGKEAVYPLVEFILQFKRLNKA